MPFTTLEFGGHEAVRLDAEDVSLIATTSVGPRILGLLAPDGANTLVELPDLVLPCPGSEPCHLYGGHRLWAAPEVPRVTYRADDEPVSMDEVADGVRLTAPLETVSQTQRHISIQVLGPRRFEVTHRIANRADHSQRLAAWAITMVPTGGRAWLPLLREPYDRGGFQAQRNIVLWPYTRLDDPRLALSDSALEVRTDGLEQAALTDLVKVGTTNRRGWVAYWRAGSLLLKRATHDEGLSYADMGASAQVYAGPDFMELETLGPLVDLAPGEAAVHVEEWEVHLVDEAEAERLVASGELDG
jgi:hypothetical protein